MALPRTGYLAKLALMYLLILADLGINSTADNKDQPHPLYETWDPYIYMGVQLLIQLLLFLLVFATLSATYLFQVGLVGVLLKEFRTLLIAIPVYAAIYIIYAGVKIALLLQNAESQDALWGFGSFIFFSILQKVAALVYYLVFIRSFSRLGEARWFQRGPWVTRFAAGATGSKF